MVLPMFKLVPRTLRERWFTLPWRPFHYLKWVRDFDKERAMSLLEKESNRRRQARPSVPPAPVGPIPFRVSRVRAAPYKRLEKLTPVQLTALQSPESSPLDDWHRFSAGEPVTYRTDPEPEPIRSGGGGDFAGAGASGAWDAPKAVAFEPAPDTSTPLWSNDDCKSGYTATESTPTDTSSPSSSDSTDSTSTSGSDS